MSSVLEIETAVEQLPEDQYQAFRAWLEIHESMRQPPSPEMKREALRKTRGALRGKDGDDFERCVQEEQTTH